MVSGNKLTGVPFGGDAATVEAKSVYALSQLTGSDVIGLYLYSGTQITANHAYLSKTAVAGAPELTFSYGGTTGIQPTVVKTQQANAPIYNLQGQRVSRTQSGNIYIQGGKKFIAK